MIALAIALALWGVLAYLGFLKHLAAQKPPENPLDQRLAAAEKTIAELTTRVSAVEAGRAFGGR